MLYLSICSYRHITCYYDNCQHRATYFYEVVVSRSACLPKLVLLPSGLTDRHQTLYNTTSKKLSVPEGCFYCVWGSKYRFCVPQNHGSKAEICRCSINHFYTMTPPTPNTRKNKGGRPKKSEEELRLYPVKVYFDETNYRKLISRSQRTGQSLSSIVYELAVNGYVKEPIPHDVITLLRSLAGMANNLNQIAREAHVSHFSHVEKRAREAASKIDDLLIRISEK